jgi:hypothetical protein
MQKAFETDFASVLEISGVFLIISSCVFLNTTGWLRLGDFLFSDLCRSSLNNGSLSC